LTKGRKLWSQRDTTTALGFASLLGTTGRGCHVRLIFSLVAGYALRIVAVGSLFFVFSARGDSRCNIFILFPVFSDLPLSLFELLRTG
jgi:hypothetical protein